MSFLGALVFILAGMPPPLPDSKTIETGNPVTVLSIMFASFEQVETLAEGHAIKLSELFKRSWIEKKFPFIGTAGIDPHRPSGFLIVCGPGISKDHQFVLILPVKPMIATIRSFRDRGARLIDGARDTVASGNFSFRRTDDYLIIGPSAEIIGGVNAAADAALIRNQGVLIRLVLDVKAMIAFASSLWSNNQAEASKRENPLREYLRQLLFRYVSKLTRLEASISVHGKSIRINVILEPVDLKLDRMFLQPVLPANTAFRMDFVRTFHGDQDWLMNTIERLAESGILWGGADPRSRYRELRKPFLNLLRILFTADVITIGLELANGEWVLHQVNQYMNPPEFTELIEKWVVETNRLIAESKYLGLASIKQTEYALDESIVRRIELPGEKASYLDFSQREKTISWSLSMGHGRNHSIAARLNASGAGIKSILSGTLDLGKSIAAASELRIGPVGLYNDNPRDSVARSLEDQWVSWDLRSEGDKAVLDLTIPDSLLNFVGHRVPGFVGSSPMIRDSHSSIMSIVLWTIAFIGVVGLVVALVLFNNWMYRRQSLIENRKGR